VAKAKNAPCLCDCKCGCTEGNECTCGKKGAGKEVKRHACGNPECKCGCNVGGDCDCESKQERKSRIKVAGCGPSSMTCGPNGCDPTNAISYTPPSRQVYQGWYYPMLSTGPSYQPVYGYYYLVSSPSYNYQNYYAPNYSLPNYNYRSYVPSYNYASYAPSFRSSGRSFGGRLMGGGGGSCVGRG
jgi:hypothetical protein